MTGSAMNICNLFKFYCHCLSLPPTLRYALRFRGSLVFLPHGGSRISFPRASRACGWDVFPPGCLFYFWGWADQNQQWVEGRFGLLCVRSPTRIVRWKVSAYVCVSVHFFMIIFLFTHLAHRYSFV